MKKNSQLVNLAADFNIAGSNNISIGLNLRFRPDCFIVKQVSYATATPTNIPLQIYTDMCEDLVIATFIDANTNQELDHHCSMSQKVQNRTWNFQIQTLPTNGTGPGPLAAIGGGALIGRLIIILEFVQY